MQSVPKFLDFAEQIVMLPTHGLTERELRAFILQSSETTRVYYAPFDWINTAAQVVIVGITPGEDSMLIAFRAATSALRGGETADEASKRGKRAGSFSNMRFAIADMLDELCLPEVLEINRSEELFNARYDLLHPTSCVRYPVFVWSKQKQKWVNYTGHSPKLLRWDTSVRYIDQVLADELRQIPGALVVPCGEAVDDALRHLSAKGMLDPRRCLFGFPHASGANGHRKKFFEERKDQLRRTVADWGHRAAAVPTRISRSV